MGDKVKQKANMKELYYNIYEGEKKYEVIKTYLKIKEKILKWKIAIDAQNKYTDKEEIQSKLKEIENMITTPTS